MGRSAFAIVYKYWNWIGVPVMLIAMTVLVLLIQGVVAVVREAYLFKVPLSQIQKLQFTDAGPVVLSVEGPRLTTAFAHLTFELSGTEGERIVGRRAWFHARTSGISKARMELLSFDLPRPGRYTLRITGLGEAQEKDSTLGVVFMRPHLLRSLACIVGIVLTSAVFIVSLVFFLLRLREQGFRA